MIEMDQFAVALSGEESQTIERQSLESVATMKNVGKTIEEFVFIFNFFMFNETFKFDVRNK